MKHFVKFFVPCIVCAFICLCILFFVKKTKTDPIDTDYAAYYESIIESDAWQSEIDHSVCVAMLQLPEEMILAMDTETLADAVLAYPYFMDIYAFDSIEMGVNILFDNFNGLRALEQREEAADVLLRKYKEFKVLSASDAETMDSAAVGAELFALSNLEVLLAQDFVTQGLDDAGLRELFEEAARKYEEKKECGSYGFTLDTFYQVLGTTCKNEKAYDQIIQ